MSAAQEPPRNERHQQDWELVQQTLSGDSTAVAALGTRLECVAKILAVINARMGRPLAGEDLADLVQDTSVVIWKKLKTFQGRATLETWAHRISFLEFMNRIRALDRLPVSGVELEAVAPGGSSDGAMALEYERLEAALVELGPPEADIVRLKHYEDLTFTEIGATLGVSPNTAKTQYYRGITWLRRHLTAREREART